MAGPHRYFTSFVGRRSVLAVVRQRLASPDVASLVGPGGVGKTRLAIRALDDASRYFPDGVWFVEVGELALGRLVSVAVCDSLGLHVRPESDPVSVLLDYLANRKALIALDSSERHRVACAELVDVLRAGCPHLRFLVTGRQPLGISGESVIPVEPLSVPDGRTTLPVEALRQYEAIELFVERATAASARFRLTPENAEAVARLCTALEGIPLAIELAAARSRVLTPQTMLDNMSDRYDLLRHGYLDASDRHQSLRACVAWSHDLCTPAEQALWGRLSVFRGGVELDAVVAVCADQSVSPDELLDLLSSLADQSVVEVDSTSSGALRYMMLDYIGDFGREKLTETPGEADHWRGRHLEWCLGLAEQFQAAWVDARQVAELRRLRRERANIESALGFCAESVDRTSAGLVLAVKLDQYWLATGQYDQARHWLGVADRPESGEPLTRAAALALAARFAFYQQDEPAGRRQLEQAAEILAQHPDERVEALTTLAGAFALTPSDPDLSTSTEAARKAAQVLRTTGDTADELLALSLAGVLLAHAGDRAGAVEAYEECITLAEHTGEKYRRAFCLVGLAEQAISDGDLPRAGALLAAALRFKVELDDTLGVAVALESLGRVAAASQEWERATTLLGAAEGIRERIGMVETHTPFSIPSDRFEDAQVARARLGTRSFRKTFRNGAGLDLLDAVAFALLETGPPKASSHASSPLTRRESEVADLVADGLSNPEIAERLFISVRTAQGHVENILRKLGFNSRSLIVAWVIEQRHASTVGPPEPPG